jgi:hypothetical protein
MVDEVVLRHLKDAHRLKDRYFRAPHAGQERILALVLQVRMISPSGTKAPLSIFRR